MNSLECDKGILLWIAVLLVSALSVSCTGPRKAIYFQALTDSVFQSNTTAPELVVRPNDLLQIDITNEGVDSSRNPASAIQSNDNTHIAEFLVDRSGTLVIPYLGAVQAGGLTKAQLQRVIADSLSARGLLSKPLVIVRVKTFSVTVLGEVGKPGTFQVPGEKITIMQAIGLAGDVSINGRRDKVLLVREEGGKRTSRRINLHGLELFASPYYYLKPDDLIYIEPDQARLTSTNKARQLLPIIASVLSLAVIVVDRFVWR